MVDDNSAIFKKVYELSSVGLGVVDANGKFTYVNAAYAKLLGYTIEELTNLTYQDITHADDLQTDAEQAERVEKKARCPSILRTKGMYAKMAQLSGSESISLISTEKTIFRNTF